MKKERSPLGRSGEMPLIVDEGAKQRKKSNGRAQKTIQKRRIRKTWEILKSNTDRFKKKKKSIFFQASCNCYAKTAFLHRSLLSLLKNLYFSFVFFCLLLKRNQQPYRCFDICFCFPNTKPAKDPFWVQVAYQFCVVKALLYFVANSTQGSNMASTTSVCLFCFPA